MSHSKKTCPDCECALEQVKLLAAGGSSWATGSFDLRYTAPQSSQGAQGGTPDPKAVQGWICPECNRILLYGQAADR
jgi:hypothetical protein